jgi:hypothetical protein
MADIKDLNINEIKQFLRVNAVPIDRDNDVNYENAFNLMRRKDIIYDPLSIVIWMKAYNLITKKIMIPRYTADDIYDMSENDRALLAKKLTMKTTNVEHMIDILRYIHKLD